MKIYIYIAILLIAAACKPHNNPTPSITQVDSIYTTVDIKAHGDYYKSGHQVYAIDLLSEGLSYDSLGYIIGSGYNLFLSDIFAPEDCTTHLPAGTYLMDSIAKEMTFLHGMYFEPNLTGTYLLEIKENKIQRITLFTAGSMIIDYIDEDTLLNFNLYTSDSTHYRATFHGYVH